MAGYRSFAVTVQGGSHIKSGAVCQDASDFYDDGSVSIAVAADGHGDSSCFRSDRGAKFAVECATEGIKQLANELESLFDPKKENLTVDCTTEEIEQLENEPESLSDSKKKNLLEKTKEFIENSIEKTNEFIESIEPNSDPPVYKELERLIRKKRINEQKLKKLICEKRTNEQTKYINTYRELNKIIHRELEKFIRDRLIRQTVASWNMRVMENYQKDPFTEQELENVSEKYRERYKKGENINKAYGASLIAAAITPWYWFGFHIGDGRFSVLYKDGEGDQPVPWDPKCFLNVTTSICDDDILDRGEEGVRVFLSLHSKKAPAALFICSDGIDDNYPADEKENAECLYRLYREIAVTFAEDGYESTFGKDGKSGQLKDLANGFATKGKGDDTSLAGIVNMEELKKAAPQWKEKMAADEAERKKAADEAKAKIKAETEEREAAAARKEARRAEREAAPASLAGEKPKETETQPVKTEPEKPTTAARNAAAEYQKNMGSAKVNIENYGGFVSQKPEIGKKEP